MKLCPKCDSEYDDEVDFCLGCGGPLTQMPAGYVHEKPEAKTSEKPCEHPPSEPKTEKRVSPSNAPVKPVGGNGSCELEEVLKVLKDLKAAVESGAKTPPSSTSFWKVFLATILAGVTVILLSKIPGCGLGVATEFSSPKGVKTEFGTLIRGDMQIDYHSNTWR